MFPYGLAEQINPIISPSVCFVPINSKEKMKRKIINMKREKRKEKREKRKEKREKRKEKKSSQSGPVSVKAE